MDIAAMSMMKSASSVKQAAGFAAAKNAMEFQETSAKNLLEMMKAPGQLLDVRA